LCRCGGARHHFIFTADVIMNTFSVSTVRSLTVVSLPSDLWMRREWQDELLPAIEPYGNAVRAEQLVLDLSAVDHITSKTVYCLLLVRTHFLGEQETPLHLALPSTTNRRVFEILKLPPYMFKLYDSVEDAIERLEQR
jgi:hypothetical protein